MDWNSYTCPSSLCAGSQWLVERCHESIELWRIAAESTDSGFLVASPEPICPRCAERLLPAMEMKGGPRNELHAA